MELTPILEEASRRIDCPVQDLEWFSWGEVFPSSAGPYLRAGGQTMTTFQVFAFAHPSESKAIKCCAGVWKTWDRLVCSRW